MVRCEKCGWVAASSDAPEGFTCGVCRMMEQSGKVFQEKLDRLQERVSQLEEQVRRADAERTLVAQLVCRVESLENKLAARASNEEESRKQQKQETEPGVGSRVEQQQGGEPGGGSREETSSILVKPVPRQGEGEPPHAHPQEPIERSKQETPTEGAGVVGTGDTKDTAEGQEFSSPEREAREERTSKGSKPTTDEKAQNSRRESEPGGGTVPPPKGCRVQQMRPPENISREVIVAGDGNVGRFAKALVQRLGDDGSVEYLYRRGTTVDQIHQFIGAYEKQARKVPRTFVLHLGLEEVLKGEAGRLGAKLEEAWADKGSNLIVCSIPEITGRGRTLLADLVLANERLQTLCAKVGARFLDLAKVLWGRSAPRGRGNSRSRSPFFRTETTKRFATRIKKGSRQSGTQHGGPLGSSGTAGEEPPPGTLPKGQREGRGSRGRRHKKNRKHRGCVKEQEVQDTEEWLGFVGPAELDHIIAGIEAGTASRFGWVSGISLEELGPYQRWKPSSGPAGPQTSQRYISMSPTRERYVVKASMTTQAGVAFCSKRDLGRCEQGGGRCHVGRRRAPSVNSVAEERSR
ncbi:hypothetical protein HPB48_005537 [Haemaphysalis longicornis]|uniref:Uncharacterized protein n=1 Tax=Haemaphysalis longicornis TaxID=44386 RepID=A0A9J6H3C0_HAELO|nr:hypothetical protein HPB48_005537 [Haemaphysalis longicornis]